MRLVILRGPDQYLRGAYTRALLEALTEEYGEVEQFAFDGERAEAAEVLDEVRSYGLLHQHKLVIVDRADKFLAVKEQDANGPGRGRKTARELLEKYAAQPVDSATLLLRADTWRPGRLDKVVEEVGGIIKCEAPTEARAVTWCRERCKKAHGCEITAEAAGRLVELIGPELARLDGELGKLSAYAGGEGRIGVESVRELVGMSREEQAWEIQSALLSGSAGAAVGKLRELLEVSRQPEQLLGWAMADLMRKVHAAGQLLRQGMGGGAVMKELRLWGDSGQAVVSAGRRVEVGEAAALLRGCLEADRRLKRGVGKASRTLESIAVQIADTMGSGRG